jgi:hypothetical protein
VLVQIDAQAKAQQFWSSHWCMICSVAVPCVAVPVALVVKILRM